MRFSFLGATVKAHQAIPGEEEGIPSLHRIPFGFPFRCFSGHHLSLSLKHKVDFLLVFMAVWDIGASVVKVYYEQAEYLISCR